MELLKKLYTIYSPSRKEIDMQDFILDYLNGKENVVTDIDKFGNIYVTKGVSDNYPCIAAHMDQVQRLHSDDFRVCEIIDDNRNTILYGYSVKNHRLEGLGADDKNGIWIALRMLEKFDVLKCSFFVGEEIGCVGSLNADIEWFKDCRFVLQVDRKGNDDFVTTISSDLCSKEFIEDVNCELYGYKVSNGLMTDVDTLRENGLEISCCNMSCGYYYPHTDYEITIWEDLLKCFGFVYGIIINCNKVYPFEMQFHQYTGKFGFSDFYDSYGCSGYDDFDDKFYIDSQIYDIIDSCEGNITFDKVWNEIKDNAKSAGISKRQCKKLFEINKSDYEYNIPVFENIPSSKIAETIKTH